MLKIDTCDNNGEGHLKWEWITWISSAATPSTTKTKRIIFIFIPIWYIRLRCVRFNIAFIFCDLCLFFLIYSLLFGDAFFVCVLIFGFRKFGINRHLYRSLSSMILSAERSFMYLLQMFFERVLALMDYQLSLLETFLIFIYFLLFCVLVFIGMMSIEHVRFVHCSCMSVYLRIRCVNVLYAQNWNLQNNSQNKYGIR